MFSTWADDRRNFRPEPLSKEDKLALLKEKPEPLKFKGVDFIAEEFLADQVSGECSYLQLLTWLDKANLWVQEQIVKKKVKRG